MGWMASLLGLGRTAPAAAPTNRRARNEESAEIVRRRIQRRLNEDYGLSPRIRVRVGDGTGLTLKDVRFVREGDGFLVELPARMGKSVRERGIATRASCYLAQFARAEGAERMTVTLSDGQLPSMARFSPSPMSPAQVAIPDSYFFRFKGFSDADAAYAEGPSWQDRDDALIWRGAPNGNGILTWDAALVDRPGIMPRCRMLLRTEGTAIDAGFVFPDRHRLRRYAPQFEARGLTRPRKDKLSWVNHRFFLDIDGHTNTWDTIPLRMKLGCCMLKVDSEPGFRQWYYDRLKPWENYVPVRSDMADLMERYDWLLSNPARAREIAEAGREMAAAMTVAREWTEGARIIAAHWNG